MLDGRMIVVMGMAGQDLRFIHLTADRATLYRRLNERPGHFMPASLLDSQLALLECPGEDEHALPLHAGQDVPKLVGQAMRWPGLGHDCDPSADRSAR